MRSFQVCRCGEPMQFAERIDPKPVGHEVLLKVLAAGVCHSDLHIWEGFYDLGHGKKLLLQERGVKLPLTMGHENVGEVVAVGPRARGVKVGDKRLVYPWIGCGTCMVCKRGDEQLCTSPRFLGVYRDGGYATHLLVPHPRYLLNYGSRMKPEQAAPLACSGVTAYGALKKLGSLVKSEPVVVIGAGGLGLICIAIIKAMKGKGAIAVDIDPVKREAAKRAGAFATVDPNAPDAVAQLQAAAKGPVWAAIDFVGNSQTAQLAVDSLIKGGKLIVVGLFGGDITLSLPLIPIRAMTIQGSYTGSLKELNELIKLVRNRPLPLVPTKTTALDSAQHVIADIKAGKVIGRTVLTPASG
jgi:D-arabinose 1-dehydrogenase-like Zn-dependent alcohol dehydrogenase